MKFIEMKKQLPNTDKRLFNITGDDFFLIRQAVQNLKTFFVKDLEDFNFAKIEAVKLSVTEVEPMVSTLPIREGFRLVIMENPNADIVKFINSLNLDDSSTILVCINADNLKTISEYNSSARLGYLSDGTISEDTIKTLQSLQTEDNEVFLDAKASTLTDSILQSLQEFFL